MKLDEKSNTQLPDKLINYTDQSPNKINIKPTHIETNIINSKSNSD